MKKQPKIICEICDSAGAADYKGYELCLSCLKEHGECYECGDLIRDGHEADSNDDGDIICDNCYMSPADHEAARAEYYEMHTDKAWRA